MIKKDRGRPSDPKARPKAYGEVNIVSNIPGVELLQQDDDDVDEDNDDGDDVDGSSGSDDGHDNDEMVAATDSEENEMYIDDTASEDGDMQDDFVDEDGDNSVDENDSNVSDDEEEEDNYMEEEGHENTNNSHRTRDNNIRISLDGVNKSKAGKRKFSDFDGQLIAAETSLRALKRLAEEKLKPTSLDSTDGILSNEDFQRIKELKVC